MKNSLRLTTILFLAVGPGGAFAQNPGSLDLSFDPGTGLGGGGIMDCAAIQSDGKILIGGYFTSYNGTPRNHIARLNVDGSLDVTFNPGTGANARVKTIAIQNDGRIVIGGYFTSYNGTPRNGIARLLANGNLDFSFNPGAGVSGSDGAVYASAIQSDGRIIIGGIFTVYDGTSRDYIARLNANGSLDTSFDPGWGVEYHVYTTSIQSDGRILIGGLISYGIARLNADGSLDATFDPGAGVGGAVYRTVLQSDGRPVIVGSFDSYNGTARNCIARLNDDGTLDTTFDPGAGVDGGIHPRLFTVAIQSDGMIIIGGDFASYSGTPRNCIARLNVDGSLDVAFDPGAGVEGSSFPHLTTTAIQDDGKIVIGGVFITYDGTPRIEIARVNSEGIVAMDGFTSHEFSIFPNPASSSVTIIMTDQPCSRELVLRDALGQEVMRSTVTAGRNEVPLSGLAPGVYAVQVNASSIRRTQWLVKE